MMDDQQFFIGNDAALALEALNNQDTLSILSDATLVFNPSTTAVNGAIDLGMHEPDDVMATSSFNIAPQQIHYPRYQDGDRTLIQDVEAFGD